MRRQHASLDAWQLLRQEITDALETLRARSQSIDGASDNGDRTWERIGEAYWMESDLNELAVACEEEIARLKDQG
jgi:hypothetical protein